MRRMVPQAVSLCLMAGLIFPGAQGFPVYAAETEVAAEADGETVSETTVDTELTDTSVSETDTETTGETAAETTEASDEEASVSDEGTDETETEEKDSVIGELIFAQCEDYINVRTMASTDSAITAKIYNNDSATVIAVTEDQEWYIVASGNACGYVKAEYFATGEEAEAIANEVAYNVARVYADELNVRAEASTDSEVIDIATAGEEIEVVLYGDDWMKVALGNDVYGYVNSDYVEYITYYPVGETLEEEAARLGLDVTSVETEADKDAEAKTEVSEETIVEENDTAYEETWAETEAVAAETAAQTEAAQNETTVQTEAAQTETTAQTETEAVQTETTAQTETEAVQTETTAQTETEAVQTETTAQTETEAVQTET
ncbi:MAG: SH3 domain-containing protein, partial [Lachnospiraceae bacterium]|nr:SH3 domain-containing protein [Lachnospiraceae bacterium]